MTRRYPGLNQHHSAVPEGIFLVRVDAAQYRWHRQRPFYLLRFSVLEPAEFAGSAIRARIDCAAKAVWKLGWFLRDFQYDDRLLERDEVDEKLMAGLRGVVKVSHGSNAGTSLLDLDAFAPASKWQEMSSSARSEAHHDL